MTAQAYPTRMSTDEIQGELAVYLAMRTAQGAAEATRKLDQQKVEQFLTWLNTGELPGRHA